MLLPAPDGAEIGDDVMGQLGIMHYEPAPQMQGDGFTADPPVLTTPVYDVENARSNAESAWPIGLDLVATEKIHGQNWRAVVVDGVLHVGSRTRWVAPGASWWITLRHHPEIKAWLFDNPGHVLYGEEYGGVGRFPYGTQQGERRLRIFDCFEGGGFWPWAAIESRCEGLPLVPVLGRVEWSGSFDQINDFAEGKTMIGGGHVREGAVLRPYVERDGLERRILKLVGRGYLAKTRRAQKRRRAK